MIVGYGPGLDSEVKNWIDKANQKLKVERFFESMKASAFKAIEEGRSVSVNLEHDTEKVRYFYYSSPCDALYKGCRYIISFDSMVTPQNDLGVMPPAMPEREIVERMSVLFGDNQGKVTVALAEEESDEPTVMEAVPGRSAWL